MISSLAVFLGSRNGQDPRWREAAYATGKALADHGITLVYGGGGSGLMGALSDGALEHGGKVVGVIPAFMVEREWGRHSGSHPSGGHLEMHVVQTMHERKALMTERSEAFLALPGGLGTLEEVFEVWSWLTLGLHHKPFGFLDVAGFWHPQLQMLHRMVDEGFIDAKTVDALVVDADLDAVLTGLGERIRSGRRGRHTDQSP